MSDNNPVEATGQVVELPFYDQVVKLLGPGVCKRLGIYPIPEDLIVSVVIPVYNECHTLHLILDKVRAVAIPKQIILVDDCSKDGTRELLQRMSETDKDLTIAFHDVNQGKGAALRTGFGLATGQIVIVQDADMEYDPSEYPRVIEPILDGRADVVFG